MAIIGTPIMAYTSQTVIGASSVAPAYSNAASYAVGDIVTYKGSLYKCNTAISVAEPWDAEHWTAISLLDELGRVEAIASSDRAATFVYEQSPAASEWVIEHNLDNYPSVTVVDSAGNVVYGDVQYQGKNTVVIQFASAFSGKAYIN